MSPLVRPLIAAALMLAIPGRPAAAAEFPIVPFSSGNLIDVLARGFSEALGRAIKGPILVINREGRLASSP